MEIFVNECPDTLCFIYRGRPSVHELNTMSCGLAIKTLVAGIAILLSSSAAWPDEPFSYLDKSASAARFSLVILTPGRYCSGVLIAPDVVLTAAHCLGLKGLVPNEVELVFAVALPQDSHVDSGQNCRGQKIAINPLWGSSEAPNAQAAFDMALIKFSCQLPPRYRPIKIDYDEIKNQIVGRSNDGIMTNDIPMSMVGYGVLAADNADPRMSRATEKFDRRLKSRHVKVRTARVVDVEAIVTLQGERGFLCHGDSGGGVFFIDSSNEPSLFAINTRTGFGQGCTTTSFAARVDLNYDWLHDAMSQIGAHGQVPERLLGASGCAKTQSIAHAASSPPFKEVRTTNLCSRPIGCAMIGWNLLPSKRISNFKETFRIEPGAEYATKIFMHDPTSDGFVTAICDQD